jgi:DDE superfamily endonuclease
MQLPSSDQICHAISSVLSSGVKSTISLLQSLSSNRTARSAIELSENVLYGHHYSSISQSVSGLSRDAKSHGLLEESLQKIYMDYYEEQSIYILQTDTTPIVKAFSAKLADRQYIQIPNNVIAGNKSLSIGYKYSYVNLGYRPLLGSRWSLPLSVKRVTSDTTSVRTATEQTHNLLKNKLLPFGKARLVIQTVDSGYCTPKFIAPLIESYDNLAIIVRFRHGSKVWQQASKEAENGTNKRGTPSIYGDTTYYLQTRTGLHATKNGKTKEIGSKMRTAIYDLPCSECHIIEEKTSRGRALKIEIRLWKNLMIRAKEGNNMKDKPFNLISVQVADAQTGELLFQKPMFIGIFGKPKEQITALEGYQYYRQRYDIEGHNRFSKQRLLLEKYQTPDVQTLDNWTLLVACAYWLLFVAADDVDANPKPWEMYLPKVKELLKQKDEQNDQHIEQTEQEKKPKLSVAQTQKAAANLFNTFDRKPFMPKSVKNGKGRKKGDKQPPKKSFKVVKKSDFDNKTRKNE